MTRLSSYPWHICGVGAIGSLWASALTTHGSTVTLLLKGKTQLAQYQAAGGVNVLSDDVHTCIHPKAFIPHSPPTEKIKHLLVCCKSYATLDAILPWRQHLAHDAQIMLLQNGMGSAQELQRALPKANIYCATSTDGAWRKGPFDVVRAGHGETFIGIFSDHLLDAEIPASIQSLLQASQDSDDHKHKPPAPILNISWHTDIRTPMWHKLAVNSVINALTAIYQCPNGELINHPQGWPRLQQLCIETQDVMARVGIVPLGQGLLNTALRILQKTALNKSSMLQDCQAGSPTEIEAINGYIIEQGALYHLPCAGHKQVCEDLRRICAS
ncbi:2-dehydropantoate 2-reductase [Candidatus Njordibacter sp. Uisw_039]|jgi:2-dehydropantoate 2-reductase|uniref:ketopantoate reductase family protein n=1 Tax=Candidatus Njordibacter sp. Uisw_039 TaxID=3230972 RepID=UPI003D41A180